MRRRFMPAHVDMDERQGGHHQHDQQDDGHRVALEVPDRAVAPGRDADLDQHYRQGDEVLQLHATADAHPLQGGDGQIQHDPGVGGHPAHRHEYLHESRQVGPAPTEGQAREHHLRNAGAVPHEGHRTEQGASQEIADQDHQQRLDQAQPERNTDGAEHPIDRRDVGA
ncbi:hypothetical protein D3C76_875850 [compost metagenome]